MAGSKNFKIKADFCGKLRILTIDKYLKIINIRKCVSPFS